PGELDDADRTMLAACDTAITEAAAALESRHFRDGLRAGMSLAQQGNRYVDQKQPWVTVKQDKKAAATSLWVGLNVIATLKTVFAPILPSSCEKIHGMLGLPGTRAEGGWSRAEVKPGSRLGTPEPLFRKLDDSIVDEENARLVRPG
ncbi:MAG: class I tRNA ligase family protein, partial [Chloroflexi bacterium]|nr:class I tRNA ligase family protein [Chloroflexota bacterium]